jgi:hypothetical protein
MRAIGFLVVFGALATASLVYFDVINLSGQVSVGVTDSALNQAKQAADDLRNAAADQLKTKP